MRGNMGALLKQAARVQENIKRLQHELDHLEVTGSASGNLVQVTMTCKHALKSVKVDPSLLQEDVDMVEDLIFMATKDCLDQIEKITKETPAAATPRLTLPPGKSFQRRPRRSRLVLIWTI